MPTRDHASSIIFPHLILCRNLRLHSIPAQCVTQEPLAFVNQIFPSAPMSTLISANIAPSHEWTNRHLEILLRLHSRLLGLVVQIPLLPVLLPESPFLTDLHTDNTECEDTDDGVSGS